ncbi:DUF1697 domain-containing protein [Paenibacillus sp. YPG26]|uniref:DUF1697 domain-containing protein n=1 Tax=Paenibacillus sp. YPG26 TaxID=2878915 RepID=UPI00203BE151|nr:DUF1697 domain-containing protein [Paenibacillus sp. YPG26]USB31842.1 DUF1697 domain-containing protein [Paenibacillus sp. YPG26]
MIYIALLRGINVGGNNKIKMADLRTALENRGLKRVKTYIQSGNVLFESEKDEASLAIEIEDEIYTTFGIRLKVMLRTSQELEDLIVHSPFAHRELSDGESLYVSLLGEPLSEEGLQKLEQCEKANDEFAVVGREVYFLFRRSILDSKLGDALVKTKIPSTSRNWNTINKLHALAVEMKQQV